LSSVVGLLQLDEHTHVVLGLQKHARLAAGAHGKVHDGQAAHTGFTQVPLRRVNVVHCEGDVVNAAVGIRPKKLSYGTVGRRGVEKLDADVRELHEDFGYHEEGVVDWVTDL